MTAVIEAGSPEYREAVLEMRFLAKNGLTQKVQMPPMASFSEGEKINFWNLGKDQTNKVLTVKATATFNPGTEYEFKAPVIADYRIYDHELIFALVDALGKHANKPLLIQADLVVKTVTVDGVEQPRLASERYTANIVGFRIVEATAVIIPQIKPIIQQQVSIGNTVD